MRVVRSFVPVVRLPKHPRRWLDDVLAVRVINNSLNARKLSVVLKARSSIQDDIIVPEYKES